MENKRAQKQRIKWEALDMAANLEPNELALLKLYKKKHDLKLITGPRFIKNCLAILNKYKPNYQINSN